ncbi:hypothetical protein QUB60_18615 [Microcoleus sp. A2-C5]|uniref:hypothetical protein n=1 Tax=Microcoleaceae TaxID=1892252 RepID=UPI002238D664|nr:hypothetical protein [Lyngbya sp. CCAP 1446/10]MCW6053575.1 hypothetical protein [Lyngbya sp. CCAP 1446/10]
MQAENRKSFAFDGNAKFLMRHCLREGRRKKEEGRSKREEARGKREEGRRNFSIGCCSFKLPIRNAARSPFHNTLIVF